MKMYRFCLFHQLLVHIDHINIICVTDVVNVQTRDKRVLNLNPISKIPTLYRIAKTVHKDD